MKRPASASPAFGRLALFASGDFAFNLYWQSATLFLLFYYSDVLRLGIGAAAKIFIIASLWDGAANFLVGAAVDRWAAARDYRRIVAFGAVPLALSFALIYWPPPAGGAPFAGVLAAHLVFRTLYAVVNIPYLAMTARVSALTKDRAVVSGLRMLAGAGAAVLVAVGTTPIGRFFGGTSEAQRLYFYAACVFAAAGGALLLIVAGTFRDAAPFTRPPIQSLMRSLRVLARNTAFLTLSAAMMAMIVAVTILSKSVLYYFKYVVHDENAGRLALAAMMAISAVAAPFWIDLSRRKGARVAWLLATLLAVVALAGFSVMDLRAPIPAQVFLVVVQAATIGMHFSFWALLPDTIEFGQAKTGVRVEGATFGAAALLQRVAIGAATLIIGWSFGASGYAPNVAQNDAALWAIRAAFSVLPTVFFVISAAALIVSPMRRGAHDRLVDDLAR